MGDELTSISAEPSFTRSVRSLAMISVTVAAESPRPLTCTDRRPRIVQKQVTRVSSSLSNSSAYTTGDPVGTARVKVAPSSSSVVVAQAT